MPYRRRGSQVQVKRPSGWKKLKTHKTVKKAAAHLRALNINVSHKKVR